MDTYTCPNCNHKNDLSFQYCELCGEKLVGACPDCGHINQPDFAFCESCGFALGQPEETPKPIRGLGGAPPAPAPPPQTAAPTPQPQVVVIQQERSGGNRKWWILIAAVMVLVPWCICPVPRPDPIDETAEDIPVLGESLRSIRNTVEDVVAETVGDRDGLITLPLLCDEYPELDWLCGKVADEGGDICIDWPWPWLPFNCSDNNREVAENNVPPPDPPDPPPDTTSALGSQGNQDGNDGCPYSEVYVRANVRESYWWGGDNYWATLTIEGSDNWPELNSVGRFEESLYYSGSPSYSCYRESDKVMSCALAHKDYGPPFCGKEVDYWVTSYGGYAGTEMPVCIIYRGQHVIPFPPIGGEGDSDGQAPDELDSLEVGGDGAQSCEDGYEYSEPAERCCQSEFISPSGGCCDSYPDFQLCNKNGVYECWPSNECD